MLLAGPGAAAQVERGRPQVDLPLAEVAHDAVAWFEVRNWTPGASAIDRTGCHRNSLAPGGLAARGAARHEWGRTRLLAKQDVRHKELVEAALAA